MLTGLLIAILVLVAVMGGRMVLTQWRRELPAGPEQPALPGAGGDKLLTRTVRDLRPGDVVTCEGRDFLVEGVVEYDEEGHRWNAGRLVDGADERWLVVGLERGGALTLRLLADAPDVDVTDRPPEALVSEGTRYGLDRRGTATAQVRGQSGLNLRAQAGAGAVERIRWWLYDTPSADTMLVEQWGDTMRVLRGRKVSQALVELIPGS